MRWNQAALVACFFVAALFMSAHRAGAQAIYGVAEVENSKKIAATMSKDGLLREIRAREPRNKNVVGTRYTPNPDLAALRTEEVVGFYDGTIKSLYLDDDRLNVYVNEQPGDDPEVRAVADSVVALVLVNTLMPIPDAPGGPVFQLPTTSFQQRYGLCPGERFETQPSGAFGSGILIGDDLILTAGHCIGNNDFPKEVVRFVFGFRMVDDNAAQTRIPQSEVYMAKEVVGRLQSNTGSDWAIVRLDRKVTGHKPVPVAKYRKSRADAPGEFVPANTPVFALGHPCGLPLKYTKNAQVRVNNPNQPFFSCDLDTFGGNSGSGVFAKIDGKYQVVGVLVRGLDDFADFFEAGVNCKRSVIYRLDQAGEACTRTSEFVEHLP